MRSVIPTLIKDIETPQKTLPLAVLSAIVIVTVDGIEQHDKTIPLVDDQKEHWVEVRIYVTGG